MGSQAGSPEDEEEVTAVAKGPEDDDFMLQVEARTSRRSEQRERPKTIADAAWARAIETVRGMAAEDEYKEALPLHFVALHAVLFEAVYQFAPLDLTPQTRMAACGMVAALSKAVFGEDPEKVAAYLKWVWSREEETEAWRKKNGRGGRTLGWRLVFGRSLLNDYANAVRRGVKKRT
jgi:hypothetical protein